MSNKIEDIIATIIIIIYVSLALFGIVFMFELFMLICDTRELIKLVMAMNS